jgi:ribosomal protein L7/L12
MAKGKTTTEKPLDKMTVKELKAVALELPEITGVHGMNKADLLSAVKQAKGIPEEKTKKKTGSIRELKQKIKVLKVKRRDALEAKDSKTATIYRRKISRMKTKMRRYA